jgi:superfamily II DNA/RNA helicase
MGQGFIDLGTVAIFVLDEADRMLDMGFIPDVRRVIAKLPSQPAPGEEATSGLCRPANLITAFRGIDINVEDS